MGNELDQILISYKQPNFQKKLFDFFFSKAGLSHFGLGPHHIGNRQKVEEIIRAVVVRGDEAVAEYTEEFDKVKLTPDQFRVDQSDLKKAYEQIAPELLGSIRKSIENVKRHQKEIFVGKNKKCSGGTGIKYTPIKRIGICVPGASAPLPSTVIMTAVPAQVASVEEIVVVSPKI